MLTVVAGSSKFAGAGASGVAGVVAGVVALFAVSVVAESSLLSHPVTKTNANTKHATTSKTFFFMVKILLYFNGAMPPLASLRLLAGRPAFMHTGFA